MESIISFYEKNVMISSYPGPKEKKNLWDQGNRQPTCILSLTISKLALDGIWHSGLSVCIVVSRLTPNLLSGKIICFVSMEKVWKLS